MGPARADAGDLDPATTIGGLLALLLSALTGAQNVQMSGMRADLAKFSADLAKFAGDLAAASKKHQAHVDNHTRDIADLRSRVEGESAMPPKKRPRPSPAKTGSRRPAEARLATRQEAEPASRRPVA